MVFLKGTVIPGETQEPIFYRYIAPLVVGSRYLNLTKSFEG